MLTWFGQRCNLQWMPVKMRSLKDYFDKNHFQVFYWLPLHSCEAVDHGLVENHAYSVVGMKSTNQNEYL